MTKKTFFVLTVVALLTACASRVERKYSSEKYVEPEVSSTAATLNFSSQHTGLIGRFWINTQEPKNTCNGKFDSVDGMIRKNVTWLSDSSIRAVRIPGDKPISVAANVAGVEICEPPAVVFTPRADVQYEAEITRIDIGGGRRGSSYCQLQISEIKAGNEKEKVSTETIQHCISK